MAKNNDITLYKGSAVVQNFAMDPVPSGGIAGWSIKLTVRVKATDAEAVLSKDCVIVDGPTGTFKFTLTTADTKDLEAGRYVYDVQRTNVGSEDVLSIGGFNLQQEVLYP